MTFSIPPEVEEPLVDCVKIDGDLLRATLLDPLFYRDCPIFLFLHRFVRTATTIDNWSQIMQTFASHCMEQHKLNRSNLDCLKRYFSRKQDRPVGRINLYRQTKDGVQVRSF